MKMRIGVALAALTLVALPATQASAQYNNNAVGGAIIGGTAGAIIGGAATGKAGGAIVGAAAGAAIGSEMQPRGRYYWYRGDCWRRYRDGSYHRVARRYC